MSRELPHIFRVRATITIAVGVLVIAGCASTTDSAERSPQGPVPATVRETPASTVPSATVSTPPPHSGKVSALVALAALAVKGRAPKTGYERSLFGQSWRDLDRNGCDQRNDVLRRDLTKFVLKAGTHGCLVLSGTLESPYTGQIIHFVRGQATSRDVQIDHMVALSDAWQKGAQQWTTTKREAFANDFLELRAVDSHSNESKGDSDAASWLPHRRRFWCGYVARQIAVKQKYGLWVTTAERDSMARVLNACPDQGLPRTYVIKLGGGPEQTVADAESVTKPATRPAPLVGGGEIYFKNCTAVRDAGRAPIRRGDPGYARHLDRDGDGVGCE